MEEIFGSDEGASASEGAWYQSDFFKMCFGFGAGFFVMLFAVFWLFFRRYCHRCPDLPNFQAPAHAHSEVVASDPPLIQLETTMPLALPSAGPNVMGTPV